MFIQALKQNSVQVVYIEKDKCLKSWMGDVSRDGKLEYAESEH